MIEPSTASASRASVALLAGGLGLAQLTAWGVLYYPIGLLAEPLRRSLGLSDTAVYGSYTASLLTAALFAPVAGHLIDRHGGRSVLIGSAVVGTSAFALLSVADSALTLTAAWLLAGVAMAGGLYDAAFAAVAQVEPHRYRRVVTGITLLGGLAAPVFWPSWHYLLTGVGLRWTLRILALVVVLVCVPMYALLLPRSPRPRKAEAPEYAPAMPAKAPARARICALLLTSTFAANAAASAAITSHLVPVLRTLHFSPERAVWTASVTGVAQVLGRIFDAIVGPRMTAARLGAFAFLGVACSLLVLPFSRGTPGLVLTFAVLYGAANGIVTIVKGVLPIEIFGPSQSGTTLGRFAAAPLTARALAPLGFSACAASLGTNAALLVTAFVAALAVVTFLLAWQLFASDQNPRRASLIRDVRFQPHP